MYTNIQLMSTSFIQINEISTSGSERKTKAMRGHDAVPSPMKTGKRMPISYFISIWLIFSHCSSIVNLHRGIPPALIIVNGQHFTVPLLVLTRKYIYVHKYTTHEHEFYSNK